MSSVVTLSMAIYRKTVLEALRAADLEARANGLLRRFALSFEDIDGPSRERHVVKVRHQIWQMLVDHGYSVSSVARLARKNHTTVRTAILKAKDAA